jgi:hypothetical protein
MLGLNLPNGGVAPIFNEDIFMILAKHSASPSSSTARAFKETVRGAVRRGAAVSVDTGLLTGYAERREKGGLLGKWSSGGGGNGGAPGGGGMVRVEETYVTHWTPLKDEEGRPRWVCLTIAPKD